MDAEETARALDVLFLWDELVRLLSSRGLGPAPGETPLEWAARAGPHLAGVSPEAGTSPGPGASLQLLAANATAVAYGRGPARYPAPGRAQGPGPEVPELRAAAARVTRAVGQLGPWYRRLSGRAYLARALSLSSGGNRT